MSQERSHFSQSEQESVGQRLPQTETHWTESPGERLPLDRDPLDRYPQTGDILDRDPPGQRPPWTETPQTETPWTDTPLNRHPPDRDPSGQRQDPPVDRQTPVKTLPSQTSFVGGNNVIYKCVWVSWLIVAEQKILYNFL